MNGLVVLKADEAMRPEAAVDLAAALFGAALAGAENGREEIALTVQLLRAIAEALEAARVPHSHPTMVH